MTIKIPFPWQLTLFQSHPLDFNMLVISSLKNVKQGHKVKITGSYIWSAVSKYQNGMPKVARKLLKWGMSGTNYVAMVTELLSSYCGAHLQESCCKESNVSDTNRLRHLFSSYLNKILLSVWRHHLANLHVLNLAHLWNEKRYLKIVNCIFLLI